MHLSQFQFLTDENIPFRVVAWLHQKGFSVFDINEQNLATSADTVVMNIAEPKGLLLLHKTVIWQLFYSKIKFKTQVLSF
jgi:predicted nuclease of predicted toxin-antitoxin system